MIVDFRWGWQGWLLGPEPLLTGAELESWLTGRDVDAPSAPVNLTFWRSSPEALTFLHLPRQFWLLMCSGFFLILGMTLYLAPWPHWLRWLILFSLLIGLSALLLFWPGWAPALFMGLQPGLAVAAILAFFHWVFKERYRRQLVFMPGFSRVQSGSSLTRAKGGNPPREAATVDAPPPSLARPPSQGGELTVNPAP